MLADLRDWGEEISLIPNSGIQFVDFAFDLAANRKLSRTFIERATQREGESEHLELLRIPDVGEDEDLPEIFDLRPDDLDREINSVEALEVFMEKWVPVPFLRIKDGSSLDRDAMFENGPTNWARVRVVEIPNRLRGGGPSHRIVFAFDTALEEQRPNRPYVAPTPENVTSPVFFRLASDLGKVGWFFSDTRTSEERATSRWFQGWVDDWLLSYFGAYMQRKNPRETFSPDTMEYRLEHWMRYVAFLETLETVLAPPRIKFVDTIARDPMQAQPKTARVGVDLVLDIGNSRTCGLLHESLPGRDVINLDDTLVLQLRDLERAEHIYDEPFSSQVELSQARFGEDELARRSGRKKKAFFWPSLVRVGPEAQRLRSRNDGTGADTGMSSPKRYLWDVQPVSTPWEFQPDDYPPDKVPPAIEVMARQLMNRAGDLLSDAQARRGRDRDRTMMQTATDLTFSRSSFFSLMLMEIVYQALSMVNSPGARKRREHHSLPREIRRVVLTVPPATTLQEQQIMQTRADAAMKLLWTLMGWENADGTVEDGDLARSLPARPVVQLNLDEASCVQFVWLYGEIAHKFNGGADKFVEFAGRPRPVAAPESEPEPDAPSEPSIRVASIDVGGGTTDLMITTYYLKDKRALNPVQNFREGFRIAGDDVLRGLAEQMILPAIEDALAGAGLEDPRKLLVPLFGGNTHDMSIQEKQMRRQFCDRILYPVGVAILSEHEAKPPFTDDEVDVQTILQLMGEEAVARVEAGERVVSPTVIGYLEGPAHAAGATDFRVEDVEIALDFTLLRTIVENTLGNAADQLAEVVDAFDVDVLLLSGRPARLPAVLDLFRERFPAMPDRVVSLGEYRTHQWFPFRSADNVRIGDPKTCTAVGGMLCVMSDGQIPNFTLLAERLSMRSTARYIGRVEGNEQIKDEELLFSDVDLDAGVAADDEVEMSVWAPGRIGFRQLPLERWVTTPLYKLEIRMSPGEIRDGRPFNLTLKRAQVDMDPDEVDPDKIMKLQAGREAFKIARAEDSRGRRRDPQKDFRLALCTLPNDDLYWLDTGIFSLN